MKKVRVRFLRVGLVTIRVRRRSLHGERPRLYTSARQVFRYLAPLRDSIVKRLPFGGREFPQLGRLCNDQETAMPFCTEVVSGKAQTRQANIS